MPASRKRFHRFGVRVIAQTLRTIEKRSQVLPVMPQRLSGRGWGKKHEQESPQSFWNSCASGNEWKLASRPNFRSAGGGMAADAFGIRLLHPQEIE
jgi:hypothetical protein